MVSSTHAQDLALQQGVGLVEHPDLVEGEAGKINGEVQIAGEVSQAEAKGARGVGGGDVGLSAGMDEDASPDPVIVVAFDVSEEIQELSEPDGEALDVLGGASAGTDSTDPDRSGGGFTGSGYASGSCRLDPINIPITGQEEVWLESGGVRATLRLLTPIAALTVPREKIELIGTQPTVLRVTADPACTLRDACASFNPTDEGWNKEYLDISVAGGEVALAFPHRAAGCDAVPCVGVLSLEVAWSFADVSCDGFSPCDVHGGNTGPWLWMPCGTRHDRWLDPSPLARCRGQSVLASRHQLRQPDCLFPRHHPHEIGRLVGQVTCGAGLVAGRSEGSRLHFGT